LRVHIGSGLGTEAGLDYLDHGVLPLRFSLFV
jgi:hypothetical protein